MIPPRAVALGAGVSGPDAPVLNLPLRVKPAAWPDWSRLANSKHCLLRVVRRADGPVRPAANPLELARRWRSHLESRLSPSCGSRSWRPGPGCFGPGPAPQAGSLARLVMASQVLSPSRRAAQTGLFGLLRPSWSPPPRWRPKAGSHPAAALGACISEPCCTYSYVFQKMGDILCHIQPKIRTNTNICTFYISCTYIRICTYCQYLLVFACI